MAPKPSGLDDMKKNQLKLMEKPQSSYFQIFEYYIFFQATKPGFSISVFHR